MSEIEKVVLEFRAWADNQGLRLAVGDIKVTPLGVPHKPVALPKGWQGVYAFGLGTAWLKVGRAGPNSNARWVSQHYKATRSLSNLAWSLLRYTHLSSFEHPSLPAGLKVQLTTMQPDAIGDWIKQHAVRVNITIRAGLGPVALARLESIALGTLKPVFEGRWDRGPSPNQGMHPAAQRPGGG